MFSSQFSRKLQVSIPIKVREAGGLQPGDRIGYEIHDGQVTIKKIDLFERAFHNTLAKTLDAWDPLKTKMDFVTCDRGRLSARLRTDRCWSLRTRRPLE